MLLVSISLVSLERFAPGVSLFRAVYSLKSNALVSLTWCAPCCPILWFFFERFASLVLFERFGPCPQIPQSLSSGLLLVLKFSNLFEVRSSFLVLFEQFSPCSHIL